MSFFRSAELHRIKKSFVHRLCLKINAVGRKSFGETSDHLLANNSEKLFLRGDLVKVKAEKKNLASMRQKENVKNVTHHHPSAL